MDGEDFEIMIKEDEYKALKVSQANIHKLQKEIEQLQAQSASKTQKISQLDKQLQTKEQENTFLENAILTLGTEREKISAVEAPPEEDENNSGVYEVLGASIMYGTKLDNSRSLIKGGELIKKYGRLLERVKEIDDRLESQEELISKLNKMNAENSKLLLENGAEKVLENLSQGEVKVKSL